MLRRKGKIAGEPGRGGSQPASPFGKVKKVNCPEHLVPLIQLLLAVIDYLEGVGWSLVPPLCSLIARALELYGVKPGMVRESTEKLTNLVVEWCKELDGRTPDLSELQAIVDGLEGSLVRNMGQRPPTKKEKLEVGFTKSGLHVCKDKRMSAKGKFKPKSVKPSTSRGFGKKPPNPELN